MSHRGRLIHVEFIHKQRTTLTFRISKQIPNETEKSDQKVVITSKDVEFFRKCVIDVKIEKCLWKEDPSMFEKKMCPRKKTSRT